MLLKGVVEKINDAYSIQVRIPLINGIGNNYSTTPETELPISVICSAPGSCPNFKLGDVVIVGFENDDLGKPIIIGQLFCANTKGASTATLQSLEVLGSAKLSYNTSIGKVTSEELACLTGLKGNLEKRLQFIESQLTHLK